MLRVGDGVIGRRDQLRGVVLTEDILLQHLVLQVESISDEIAEPFKVHSQLIYERITVHISGV